MNDVRSVLERESLRHELPFGSFDRLIRKRDRRRRNQRVTAGVVAFAVVAAAFAGALDLLHQSRVSPAAQTITPQNVASLRLRWQTALQRTVNYGNLPTPTVQPLIAGDLVLAGNLGRPLEAFPVKCSDNCAPRWTGEVPGGLAYPPTVSGGVAYVVSRRGFVAAFKLDCSGTCAPIWNGRAGTGAGSSPVVEGGYLFSIDPSRPRIFAFSTLCASGGARCEPSWTASLGPPVPSWWFGSSCVSLPRVAPVVSSGLVFAQGVGDFALRAFDESNGRLLWEGRPEVTFAVAQHSFMLNCHALVTSDTPSEPVVNGSTVFIAAGPSVYGYPVGCRQDGAVCRPIWRPIKFAGGQPIVSGGAVYTLDYRNQIDAFPDSCSGAGIVCRLDSRVLVPDTSAVYAGALDLGADGRLIVSYPAGKFWFGRPIKRVRVAVISPSCPTRSCQPDWVSARLPATTIWPPSTAGGVIFGSTGAILYAFPASCACGTDVSPAWTYADPSRLSPPAVSQENVFAVTGDGRLLAFGLPPLPVPAPPAASKRGAAIFYLAVALVGAAFLVAMKLRKRRRRSNPVA